MENYICDKCGYGLEIELEKTNNGDMKCPICQSHMLTAEEMQSREDIGKLIDEDKGDDDYSLEQDATDEAVDLIIIEGMNRNMKELGNDRLYQHIEGLANAEQRARYRKYFLLIGGEVPEKLLLYMLSTGESITYKI